MPLRPSRWIIAASVVCILTATLAGGWATVAVLSLFNYRSPLHAAPPAPTQPLGQPLTRRVVYVLIDALRDDTSRQAEVMPFLNELRSRGASATMHSRPPSYSQTGYSVLLTGAWPDVSDGPAVNVDYADIPTFTQDNIFSAAHRAGLKTAVSGYNWFGKLIPPADVSASFYTPGEDQVADRAVVDAALPWLKSGDYQLILIHIDQVDYAGHHEGGPLGPGWRAAARRADDLLREIAAPLDLSQDTLLITSDHGQIDQGGHGGPDSVALLEPFVLMGAGVKPGLAENVQMVDVAHTLAVLLGTNLPATGQGRPLSAVLTLTSQQAVQLDTALAAQQTQMVNAYLAAIGAKPAPDTAGPANYQATLEAAQTARLGQERLVRVPLVVIAWLILLALLVTQRRQGMAWGLAGGLLYLVLFNLRYAVLDRQSYSFSAILSPTDLGIYTGVTSLVAFTLVWVLTLGVGGGFRQGGRRAAEMTLALALISLYGLSLPVAWSLALNGPLATWTLPDLASLYLALLSGMQIVVVGIWGVVLAGLAAWAGGRLKSGAA
jgi:hypothetical protein